MGLKPTYGMEVHGSVFMLSCVATANGTGWSLIYEYCKQESNMDLKFNDLSQHCFIAIVLNSIRSANTVMNSILHSYFNCPIVHVTFFQSPVLYDLEKFILSTHCPLGLKPRQASTSRSPNDILGYVMGQVLLITLRP